MSQDLPMLCPKCGLPTEGGYGLMGGGCGLYVYCTDETCSFFAKVQDEEEEEGSEE